MLYHPLTANVLSACVSVCVCVCVCVHDCTHVCTHVCMCTGKGWGLTFDDKFLYVTTVYFDVFLNFNKKLKKTSMKWMPVALLRKGTPRPH